MKVDRLIRLLPAPVRRLVAGVASDRQFTNLFKNASTLFSGQMIAWLLSLAALALMVRLLGPDNYGILVLITTYVTIVDSLISFKSWQAMIKFGAEALEDGDQERFKGIAKFCMVLDGTTALIGTIVAAGIATFVGQYLSWSSEIVSMVTLYSVVILFNLSGTPTGLLRLFNKYRLFSTIQIIAALIKLIGIAILFLVGASLFQVLLLWLATNIFSQLLLFGVGWWQLHEHGYYGTWRASLRAVTDHHPDIVGFVFTTNINSSLKTVATELDVLVVGALAGAAGAGLYKVAKQVAAIPAMITDPLYHAIYPDLSRLWAKGEIGLFKRLMFRASLAAGAGAIVIWAGFVIFGERFINLLFGPEFLAAQPILVVYMLAIVIAIFGLPLQPAMLAMGRPKTSLNVFIASTIFYFIILFPLINLFGVVGAAVAYVLNYAALTTVMIIIETNIFRQMEETPDIGREAE